MKPPVMRAIEYNAWTSMIDTIARRGRHIGKDYGLSGITIDVVPAYPKDLTKLVKPSIIVQKIHVGQKKLSFGNVLGQYHDEDDNSLTDVTGWLHEFTFQMNVEAKSNIQCSLISSMLTEGILLDTQLDIPLNDYIGDVYNPVRVGSIQLDRDIDSTTLSSNDNNDYVSMVRIDAEVIQSVIIQQEYVDLSKGFKFSQNISL